MKLYVVYIVYMVYIYIKINTMAIKTSRVRTSTDHIFANFNGQRFMLVTGSFQIKAIIYSTRKKLLAGKIEVPKLDNPKKLTTILITCSKDDGLKFDMI